MELTSFATWGGLRLTAVKCAFGGGIKGGKMRAPPGGVLPESRFSLELWENGTQVEEDALHGGPRVSPFQGFCFVEGR